MSVEHEGPRTDRTPLLRKNAVAGHQRGPQTAITRGPLAVGSRATADDPDGTDVIAITTDLQLPAYRNRLGRREGPASNRHLKTAMARSGEPIARRRLGGEEWNR